MHTLKVQVLSDASLVAKGVRFRLGFIGAGLTGAGLTGACRLGLPLAMLAGILAIPCVAVGAEPISSGQSQLLAQRNQPARLPNPVANRVIAQAAQQFDAPRSQIRIVGASAQVWPDGCLGLGGPAESCLAATVKGWFVVVSDGLQSVNYRTDAQGRVIRSEDKVLLPRSVARKLVEPQLLRQLTPQQLDQFKQLLDTTRFVNLDGLSYLTDAALADYPTTEYYSANTHVRFVDIDKPALPRSLQLMFSAWNELTLEP
jgi:hypothetical protein